MICSGSPSLAGSSAGQIQQGCAAFSSPAGPLDGLCLPHLGSAKASGAFQLQEAAFPVEQAARQPYQNANPAQQGAHHTQEPPFAPKQASYQPYQVGHQVMQQQQHASSWSDKPACQQQVFSNLQQQQQQQQQQQGQAFAEEGFSGSMHAGTPSLDCTGVATLHTCKHQL